VRGHAGRALGATQVLARVGHFHVYHGQVAVRVKVDARVGHYTLTVLVPEHLRFWIALCEALERYGMLFEYADVLLSYGEVGRH
jgi:hypothetical protein